MKAEAKNKIWNQRPNHAYQKFTGDCLSFPFGFVDEGKSTAADLNGGDNTWEQIVVDGRDCG